MKHALTLALSLALATGAAFAQQNAGHDAHHAGGQAAAANALAEGEVRRVDKDAKKITIRHGPLEALDMPAMTMVFQVSDPAMLDKVKAGDKVKFEAEKKGGALVLTRIEPES
jgi:Cu(I)/Ag(I) efflux system periplasmic protein CusF